jgi:hypothetical protein
VARDRSSAMAVAATACTLVALAALAALAALTFVGCGGGGATPAAHTGSGATWGAATSRGGALAGLVRDAATGDPLEAARIIAQRDFDPSAEQFAWSDVPDGTTSTAADGNYTLPLLGGMYRIAVEYGERRVELTYVGIEGGHTRGLDVAIDLTAREPVVVDVRQTGQRGTLRFRQSRPSSRGTIEGTVTDLATSERVVGAVVVSTSPAVSRVLHTTSDDAGRFALDELRPGTYTLSVYYRVVGRGNIEVRRSNIAVAAAETTVVELVLDSRGPRR